MFYIVFEFFSICVCQNNKSAFLDVFLFFCLSIVIVKIACLYKCYHIWSILLGHLYQNQSMHHLDDILKPLKVPLSH